MFIMKTAGSAPGGVQLALAEKGPFVSGFVCKSLFKERSRPVAIVSAEIKKTKVRNGIRTLRIEIEGLVIAFLCVKVVVELDICTTKIIEGWRPAIVGRHGLPHELRGR